MNTRISRFIELLCIPLFLVVAGRAVDAAQEFTIEPVPDWTDNIQVQDTNNPLESEADSGAFCLLNDEEINGSTKETFFHFAEKFLTAGGIEANSTLKFNFDPSYQQLVLNKVVIHRGDEVLDELKPDKIRLIQQEKDLDMQIYNGAETALLFLEDVHIGDWVELAYTIRGRNPVENGHFYDSIQLRWPFPIQCENYKLLWPMTNRPLWVQVSKGMPENRQSTGAYYEYYWHWENRPGQERELYLPTSTIPYAMVHFTDFRTWVDVAEWASRSFEPTNCTVEALQYVQDDIRYLGIENGVNSHEATDPSIVFHRAYGDCKDKALLLCILLDFFDNVDATPILVSTAFPKTIESFIPTPLVFDHVIVQIVINGRTYYVDPTRSYQRGPLDRRYIDKFWTGLPLQENSPGLISIPPVTNGLPKTISYENFNIATNGATRLTVDNTFEGRDADLVRREFATVSPEMRDENNLDYYKKLYPDIATAEPAETHNNDDLDEIEIVRHYSIPNIWRTAVQTNYITCEFASPGIMSRLFVPDRQDRTQPLVVLYPENFIHYIYIEPHELWRIVPTDDKIKTKYLFFYNKTYTTNDQVRVINELSTLNDRVDPADLPEYFDIVDRIPRLLGLSISKPLSSASLDASANWSILTGVTFYTIILFIGAAAIYRYRPHALLTTENAPPTLYPQLRGLGGWLIPMGIGMIIGVFWRLRTLIRTGPVYSLHSWRVLTDPASATYDPMLSPILLFELFVQLTMLVLLILLIVLFFQKRRIFPTLFLTFLFIHVIVTIVDRLLVEGHSIGGTALASREPLAETIGRMLIQLIAYGLYLSRSKRVKATFQN